MAADHDALSQRLRLPCKVHDVFLSFRGEDTRHSFTSHLYQALIEKGIKTFIDNGLRRGEYVTQLFSEIERSRICIVVFSINYAGSVCCLDELAKAIQDKEIVVLPIFYRVSPSDVRHQRGHVGYHFVSNQKIRKSASVSIGRWRNALTKLGNTSGWEVKHLITNESEIIQQVVYKVSGILQSLAYSNYIQPHTSNSLRKTGLAAPPLDERGSFEKQWYSCIFGEASQLNKPSAIPLRETMLSVSTHNSETPTGKSLRNIGVSSLRRTQPQTTSQDQQGLSLRRSSLDGVTLRREVRQLKHEVAELKNEVANRQNDRK